MCPPGLPLQGVTVVDLGQVFLGPYCTMLMSRLGADVIKVEPHRGEPIRWRNTADGAETAAFMLLNAGKRSLRIDLKSAEGRELVLGLVEQADIVVENFAPGTLQRLGLDYETLAQRNPRVILASGRGYDETGPYRDFLAMDLTVQAMSGVMACTGFPDGPPTKAGPAMADFLGGIHLFGAIMVALYSRAITGRGLPVQIAMHDAVLPTLTSNLSGLLDFGGAVPSRTGNRHGGQAVAPYNVYPAADGWVAIIAMSDRHWAALCAAMDRPELAEDPDLLHAQDRVRSVDRVDEIVSGWTRGRAKQELFDACRAAGVPSAPVTELAELFDDPQVQASGMLLPTPNSRGAPAFAFGNPLRVGPAAPAGRPAAAPELGADTEDVLTEKLGLTADNLDALRERGVI